MNNKKVLVLISAIILMIMALGTSYAFFTYDQTSTKSHSILMGDIELHYNEGSDTIALSNAFPMSKEKARAKNDNYITFTISGTNQSENDINYEIDLIYGNEVSGRNRISDKFLVFDLEEDDRLVVDAGNYDNLREYLSIWINTIPGNTNNNVTKNYKLRMWISDKIMISDSEANADYTTSEYKYLFASIKVRVLGDFAEHKRVRPYSIANTFIETSVMDNVNSEYVANDSGIIFSSNSSIYNGKGLYMRAGTENDKYPIVYFRGDIDNNNLLFANFCWKIVRSTDTGGIKVIYNGTPVDNQCTNTTGEATQIGKTVFEGSGITIAHVGYMYGTTSFSIYHKTKSDLETPYVFGNDVTWDGTSYTLINTVTSTGTWTTDYSNLDNYHYTCFTSGTTCNSIKYIFYTNNRNGAYYLSFVGGNKIEDAIDLMLTNPDNTVSSNIKPYLDSWYENNIAINQDYINKIEDTIFCNDRSFYLINGFNPNGGVSSNQPKFGAYGRESNPSLVCSKNDSFTVNETNIGNGKLTYPVSLLTVDEVRLAGGTAGSYSINYYYLNTNQSWWTISPSGITNNMTYVFGVDTDGDVVGLSTSFTEGVRPVISLSPDTKIVNGDGTSTNPYIVE